MAEEIPGESDTGGQVPQSPVGASTSPDRRGWRRWHVLAVSALAATLIAVIVGGTLLSLGYQLNPGSSARPSLSPDQWTGLEWQDITATSNGLFASDPWESGGIY